jgi:DNA-binding response OmpR family regulator
LKILVADDDLELLGLVAFALRQGGFTVVEAPDGAAAVETFRLERPDLVILDVNMPRLDGFGALRAIRAEGDVPVLMLTVRSSEEDQVQGLDLGADDYMGKPFSPRALLARVRALLRRRGAERPGTLRAGGIVLDPAQQSVTIGDGAPLRLTSLEMRLLQYLLANFERPVPADELSRHLWGIRGVGDRQLLKQLVHRLRAKIEPDAASPRYLRTVPGVGYVLVGTSSGVAS